MAFRVLVIGGPLFRDYARLRDTLDAALTNRLPDVVILTPGGPGVAALAATYATSRGLELVAIPIDYPKHRGEARDRRNAALVAWADAVVVVPGGPDADVRDMLARARAKGLPVRVVGAQDGGERIGPTRTLPGLPD